jgi:D-lactate dehydrogenase (cytochrome)
LTADLREAALRGRAGDDDGVDVAAIEFMDGRCLQVLREDSVAEKVGVALPASAGALLLVQVELDPSYDRARAVEELSTAAGDAKGPIAALCRILRRHGVLEASIPALPGEEERRRALFALREAVPDGVNARVRAAALRSGQPVSKSGGDVIVPFDRLAEALARYRAIVEATGLDSAIWGHISDGNLHPNLIARDLAGMEKAREAQKTIGEVAIALGGSPMAEHGTGRSAWKKDLLESLHGKEGVASMRRTKQALDPDWLLAPGVLFDR